jgi:hypothetical protein
MIITQASVSNRKVGSPVVFLWKPFGRLFFAKNSHYANFQRNQRRSRWKKAFFATLHVK